MYVCAYVCVYVCICACITVCVILCKMCVGMYTCMCVSVGMYICLYVLLRSSYGLGFKFSFCSQTIQSSRHLAFTVNLHILTPAAAHPC